MSIVVRKVVIRTLNHVYSNKNRQKQAKETERFTNQEIGVIIKIVISICAFASLDEILAAKYFLSAMPSLSF